MNARDVDHRIARRLFLSCLIFFPVVAAINASSIVSEASRRGAPVDWRVPWALEFTSIVAFAVPILFAVSLERRFALGARRVPLSILALLAGSVVFSLVHIVGMAALRAVTIAPLTGQSYQLLADPVRDILYEYRKDLFPYAVVIALLTLYRRFMSPTPVGVPPTSGPLELKSGSQLIRIVPATVEWAQAAGNYVELRAAGQTHLPRITLVELERLLRNEGIDIVRVHKSYIVNRSKVAALTPSGEGDIRIRLMDGSEIRGSRRYRDRLGL